MSRTGKIIVGLLSLVGVLAYNFTHTGGLLAAYVEPRFVGYVAAFGIELAVVGLSLRIDELRRTNTDAKFHIGTLAAVVVVSALANIAEGYAVRFGESLTSANIGRLDAVQAVVSLAATGLLSLVTFAIAEIVGHDIGASVPQTDTNLTQGWQPAALTPQVTPLTTASDDQPHDDKPLAPLTDHFVRSVWLAKKANAPFADVADEARQCLNGTSAALETWLATGKQSMNELAALLGVSDKSRGVFDATCRGLRKPNGATIEQD